MKFEVFQSKKNKKYYFRLKNNRGDIVLGSQGYTTKRTCMNGIDSVKRNSQVPERFDMKVARNGKVHFNIKARNGQVVATSSKWNAEKNCKTWMTSVKRSAKSAKIADMGVQ